MSRRGVLVLLLIAGSAVPARAQDQASASPAIVFIPRFAFHLSAEHLSGDDEQFVWDTNFGGELDLIDYGAGRATFVANYQAILGEEFRKFDPNQGNYILEGSASVRVAAFEVAGVFHHESRHLSDRPKRIAVDWNMMGGRVRRDFTWRTARVAARADLRGVIAKSFVDYRWELDTRVRTDVPIRPGVGTFAAVGVRRLGVDDSQNRGGQTGFRGEAGVRAQGRAGAMELFVSFERRIDPYPLEFTTARWVTVGFRLLSQ